MAENSVQQHFIYLILYQFRSKPVAAEGSESGEELEDKGVAAVADKKKYRKFNGRFKDSKHKRELRLKIPFDHLFDTLTTNPLGWMAHVGRCILGVRGTVSDPSPDTSWLSGTRFVFVPIDPQDESYTRLTKAADLAAIAHRTQSITRSSVRDDFSRKLLPRDGGCVFTGASPPAPIVGAHLIPHARQNIWLEHINKRRDTNVFDINDPKNGLTMYCAIRSVIDLRQAAILSLPSPELGMSDIADSDTNPGPGRQRPKGRRLVFQWLIPNPDQISLSVIPNNRDATFKELSPLPTPELLDYVYGASVLKAMGEVTEGFHQYQRLQGPRRPRAELPKRRGSMPRTPEERIHRCRKRGRDDSPDGGPSGGGSGAGHGSGSGRKQQRSAPGGGKSVGTAGRAVSGGRKKAPGFRPRDRRLSQEPDADGRVWRKLTDDEVDNWMTLFHMDDDTIREFEEEKEHRAPHNIRGWLSQVPTEPPA